MNIIHLRGLAAACVVAAAFAPGALAAEAGACSARHGETWAAGKQSFKIETMTDGPTCELAIATLVIRAADGVPMWYEVFAAAQVMQLAGQPDAASMKKALAEWTLPNTAQSNSSTLAAWKKGAEGPDAGEFAFYVEEGVDRDTYEAIRKAKLPMYCFVQGMESLSCLVLQDGALMKVGVQAFPG